jgi:2-polyprenyl-6-methoxyphenol hydroxylase-like FAD-dependent oxidoreductase
VNVQKVLVVGGGIGGLTAAIALRRKGVTVELVEIDPVWSVSGVGIVQQANVLRAIAGLGLLDQYLSAGFGFDWVKVFNMDGKALAALPSPRLAGAGHPANVGISRPALHKILSETAVALGAQVRLGLTVESFTDGESGVEARFTDGSSGRYDLMIGADGLFSRIRGLLFSDAPEPRFTGQSVWRHNFPRLADLDYMHIVAGPFGTAGLLPLSQDLMYLYLMTEEPNNPNMAREQLPALMRERMAPLNGLFAELREQISDPQGVVYRPLQTIFLPTPWSAGNVVLIGDAAHATTNHLGQGSGMAIEDAVVLVEEVTKPVPVSTALRAFMARRFDRCRFISNASESIGEAQMGLRHDVDRDEIARSMIEVTSQPI